MRPRWIESGVSPPVGAHFPGPIRRRKGPPGYSAGLSVGAQETESTAFRRIRSAERKWASRWSPPRRGGWAFFAGVTYLDGGDAPTTDDDQAWAAARAATGFNLVADRFWRVFRVLYPDQLLSEPTLEAQAESLRDWTLKAFRDLADEPPPPRSD